MSGDGVDRRGGDHISTVPSVEGVSPLGSVNHDSGRVRATSHTRACDTTRVAGILERLPRDASGKRRVRVADRCARPG